MLQHWGTGVSSSLQSGVVEQTERRPGHKLL